MKTFVFLIVLSACFLFGCQQQTTTNEPTKKAEAPPQPLIVEKKETPEEFKNSTKRVGDKGSEIFHKELLKNPEKYKGERINFSAKIMKIEEESGTSYIQAFLNRDYDVIIIIFPESVAVYDGDIIKVHGIAAGKFESENAMGAQMSWPLVFASYVEKL